MSSVKKKLQEKIKQLSKDINKLPDELSHESIMAYNNIISSLQCIESEIVDIKNGDIYTEDYLKLNNDIEKYKSLIIALILTDSLNNL